MFSKKSWIYHSVLIKWEYECVISHCPCCDVIVSILIICLWISDFKMNDLPDLYLLQVTMSALSLFSVIYQLLVLKSSLFHKVFQYSMLSFSVLSSVLYIIVLGLSGLWSILHIVVIGLSIITGSFQVIVLGLVTLKNPTHSYVLTPVESVWGPWTWIFCDILIAWWCVLLQL